MATVPRELERDIQSAFFHFIFSLTYSRTVTSFSFTLSIDQISLKVKTSKPNFLAKLGIPIFKVLMKLVLRLMNNQDNFFLLQHSILILVSDHKGLVLLNLVACS